MNCLATTAIGCRLDKDSFRLAVSILLGLRVCTPHRCRCCTRVDEYGLHLLSWRFSIGRLPRHTALNDVIRRSLQSAGIPALLEPAGLDRGDGNRPDGITLIPYARGKSLVWDATCAGTFSPSVPRFTPEQLPMKRNPEDGESLLPIQTGLTSSLLQSRHPEFSASQRLSSYVTWESASSRPWATYVTDTAYLIVRGNTISIAYLSNKSPIK